MIRRTLLFERFLPMSQRSLDPTDPPSPSTFAEELDEITICFAGDTGDGMHLVGTQFAHTSAIMGNETTTLPDFPAEIRAPAGTLAGVSGFQVHLSRHENHTPGDILNTLVAMNPAALKAHLADLEPGGMLIINSDAFVSPDLEKAGYASNPLSDGTLKGYRVLAVPINTLNREAIAKFNLLPREIDRCKNFFALGLVCWIFERTLDPTMRWIREKFAKNPAVMEGNLKSLRAGFHFGETSEAIPNTYRVVKAPMTAGRYRTITGIQALALGLVTASQRSHLPLVFASYPISPASELLHQLCEWKQTGVQAVQMEDEIAAACTALGASYGGNIGVTATSGPGMCLKEETLGLAVMTELPLVVINVQRAGPSTGLPTKTEQSDLFQALFGRHGECPLVVLAAASPARAFTMAFEAIRLAVRYMTPVILLTDGNLHHGAEPWKIPDLETLPTFEVVRPTAPEENATGTSPFLPYRRDERLSRPWALPGVAGLEHRIGGLEKEDPTGDVSYDPLNHEWMVQTRAKKIAHVADDIPELAVDGPDDAELLVIGWGGTYGTIQAAVLRCRKKGLKLAVAHLHYLNPLPANTGTVLKRFRKILVPELNTGQLVWLLRAQFLVDAVGFGKTQGRPFLVGEIERKIEEMLADSKTI